MAVVHFNSQWECDLVDVNFVSLQGNARPVRLFVDSGFTGASCFVLDEKLGDIALANLPSTQAAGALVGSQRRALVRCEIPAVSFERHLAAILANIESLNLPSGIQGMVGLTFLRLFASWGAEKMDDNAWRFFLATSRKKARKTE